MSVKQILHLCWRVASESATAVRRAPPRVKFWIFGLLFFTAVIPPFGGLAAWRSYRQRYQFVEATGSILETKVEQVLSRPSNADDDSDALSRAAMVYRPVVLVQYEANGTVHESWNNVAGVQSSDARTSFPNARAAEEAMQPFVAGEVTRCYYDPRSPQVSVMHRGRGPIPILILFALLDAILLAWVLASVMYVWARYRIRISSDEQSATA